LFDLNNKKWYYLKTVCPTEFSSDWNAMKKRASTVLEAAAAIGLFVLAGVSGGSLLWAILRAAFTIGNLNEAWLLLLLPTVICLAGSRLIARSHDALNDRDHRIFELELKLQHESQPPTTDAS